jgi:hypothetical protein
VSTYTAEVEKEGRRWLVAHVPEVGHTTQGRSFKELDYMVRDLVRIFTGEDPDTMEIVFQFQDPKLSEELASARAARREAAVAAERAAECGQRAARSLAAAGFTVRDIGALLGVTFQRAHQLVTGRTGRRGASPRR